MQNQNYLWKEKVKRSQNNQEFEEGITCKVKGTWQIKRNWDRVTGLEYWP